MDGSKRSAKANAFFSGLGAKKRIVLYDTLIENHTEEEVIESKNADDDVKEILRSHWFVLNGKW